MAQSRFSFFCLGLGVGGALGLLFAPKSGDQFRDELRSRADESSDYVRRRSGELRHRAEEALERGRTRVESQRSHLQAALEAGRKAYRDATGEGAGRAETPSS